MIDVKCKGCNKLLAKADSMNAAIKCPRCHMIFEYKIFSNLFVTNQYDNGLRDEKESDTISLESTRPSVLEQ
jgi:phage FluMu protein Com